MAQLAHHKNQDLKIHRGRRQSFSPIFWTIADAIAENDGEDERGDDDDDDDGSGGRDNDNNDHVAARSL